VEQFTDDDSQRFLKEKDAIELVQNTKKISEIKADDYAAIFVVGGVGQVYVDSKASLTSEARPDDRLGLGQDVCETGRGRECITCDTC
jgi:putative intracellular protease/amidase